MITSRPFTVDGDVTELQPGDHPRLPRTRGCWVVKNPSWPDGRGPYLKPCDGCPCCDPDLRQPYYDTGLFDPEAMCAAWQAERRLRGK